jgi:hypothetical protein
MLTTFLALLLAVQTAPAGSTSLVLQGTLVDKAGRPVAGRTIFSFPITDSGQVIRFPGISPDGRLLAIEPDAHPHARTDANGRFRIVYGKVTAADLSGGALLLTGMQHPGVTVGVFRRENLRTARPEDENPLMLVPAPGSSKPAITSRGSSIVVQFGKLMIPDKTQVR